MFLNALTSAGPRGGIETLSLKDEGFNDAKGSSII